MSIDLVIKILDELIQAKLGYRLDSLQREVLRGSWQGLKYPEIATEVNLTEGYVKEEGAKLWRLLSEVTGEEVNKSNFRDLTERFKIDNSTINPTFRDNGTLAIGK
jgi:broad specificity phosphatase PhoE